MSDTLFEWGVPEENWFKMPLALVRALPIMETSAEIKVVFYVLRHTWGYGEFEASKLITSEEFENGRKRRNGTHIDNGTGPCANSVRDGIKLAVKHGLLAIVEDNSDKARQKRFYKLGNSALSAHKVAPQADPQRSTPAFDPQTLPLRLCTQTRIL